MFDIGVAGQLQYPSLGEFWRRLANVTSPNFLGLTELGTFNVHHRQSDLYISYTSQAICTIWTLDIQIFKILRGLMFYISRESQTRIARWPKLP